MDKVLRKNEENPEKWEYTSDKQESDNAFAKGMLGIGHKIYCKPNSYIKTSLAATYTRVHAIVDQADDKMVYHRMADMQYRYNLQFILT